MKIVKASDFKTDSREAHDEVQSLRNRVKELEKENASLWNKLRGLTYL
jgi:hypothetical protein